MPYRLIAAICLLSFCLGGRPVFAQKAGMAIPVIAAPVVQEGFADHVEALGTTRANETVAVTANVTEIVTEIHFEDGVHVRQGDVLVTLDKSEEEGDLKAAEALLAERKAAYKRARDLERQQALSTATLEEREASLRQVEGDIKAIKARIEDRTIRAPFDGILGLREVSIGALVRPGDRITTIDDLSRIKVDFDVPAVFLRNLKRGLEIEGEVDGFPGQVFRGVVQTVDTQVDPVTRSVKVRAVLPNEDEILKPGLLMHITLYMNPRQVLLVPEEALIQRESKVYVYVIGGDGEKTVVRQREVAIGQRRPGEVEVLSGLQAGEYVVTHGTLNMADGVEVNVRAVEEDGESLQKMITTQNPAAGEAE